MDMDFNTVASDLMDPNRQLGSDCVNGTDISTVRLPYNIFGNRDQPVWETCLFYSNGDSDVVEQYSTQDDAVLGHTEWVNKLAKGWSKKG